MAVAAALAAVGLCAAPLLSTAHAAPAGFTVTETPTFTKVDVPPTGASTGDALVFTSPAAENGTGIGTNVGFCIEVDATGTNISCNWTFTLTGTGGHTAGSIAMLGVVNTQAASPAAVIGGTGGYQGVKGTAVFTPGAGGTFSVTYTFA